MPLHLLQIGFFVKGLKGSEQAREAWPPDMRHLSIA